MKTSINYLIKSIASLFFIFACQLAFAQEASNDIVIGTRATIQSDILNEERTLLISTPNGYDNSDTKYPVMYLLDGGGHFHHTTGIINFLVRNNLMSEMIVVGITNTDRTRDLTPATVSDTTNRFPTRGGADNFLKFITEELKPHVESNYRTSPYNVLVGHSFGGLFAVHTLLKQPEAFDAYIAISPSLWWDNGEMAKNAKSILTEKPDIDAQLYMTLGNEGGNMLGNVWRFAAALEEAAPETLDWKYVLMEEETHGSIPHRSTYDGLLFFFENWQLPNFNTLFEMGGIDAMDRHYARLSEKFGYDITPSENMINRLGYGCLGAGKISEAVTLFERNVNNFPNSANVYDSAGDGYDANNDLKKARKSYEQAVKLAEKNNNPNVGVYKANLERIVQKIKAN